MDRIWTPVYRTCEWRSYTGFLSVDFIMWSEEIGTNEFVWPTPHKTPSPVLGTMRSAFIRSCVLELIDAELP